MKCRNWIFQIILILGVTPALLAQIPAGTDKRDVLGWVLKGKFRPFIEAEYGYTVPEQEKLTVDFNKLAIVGAKLGYSEVRLFRRSLLSMDDRYLFGNYSSSDIDHRNVIDPDEVTAKLLRFGVGFRSGYGYPIGPIGLLPWNMHSFDLTRVATVRPDSLSLADTDILNRYEGRYSFGISGEAGVTVRLFDFLGVNGSYQMSVIYPRVVFWEWIGSYLIAAGGMSIMTVFGED
ncbi:MAG: hypothetical protein KAJ12_07745, partial [Bacteroidetes bacterium]|nr:hypothetical protein [Bacteroidota bacterium]